uniref:Uncharacterized protein n=1 Tax=Oryzias melastigma TaxID=30732 RepID=A0A3B3CR51_ORYME
RVFNKCLSFSVLDLRCVWILITLAGSYLFRQSWCPVSYVMVPFLIFPLDQESATCSSRSTCLFYLSIVAPWTNIK